MCGIAGLVRWSGRLADENGAGARMAATLRHRGPDQSGLYEDSVASIGHARLSIIDLDEGHQPASNENGSVQVVFNGEIYNHLTLRSELEAGGHHLPSRSDTEVIAHLYEELGERFVHRLNGMFAIAIWDAHSRRLLLASDRMGVKPLYWHHDGVRVLFGSELKALRAAGELNCTIDPHALADYLTFGHVPAPRTIFTGVHRLPPGHVAIFAPTGLRIRPYWEIPNEPAAGGVLGDARETFAALLEDAVRIRMAADVPLGAFLSGGLDSASIVAGMTRAGAQRVLTHTVGFREAGLDEREPARETARLLRADHHEILLSADIAATAATLSWHFDEPFADACAIPTYLLCKAARKRVTVALAGDGADELLGGYRRYRFSLAEERWRARLPRLLRRACGSIGAVYPRADWLPRPLRARVTLQNIAHDAVHAHLRSTALEQGVLPDLLMRPELQQCLAAYSPFETRAELAAGYRGDDLLGRLLYLDARTLLPDRMLTKVDRASMAVGLEVREPFMDYRLVEHIARLPAAMRLEKRVLRDTLGLWGLGAIANRRKRGFEVPLDNWFRGPLRGMTRDLLASPRARIAEWLDIAAVGRLIQRHESGRCRVGPVLWALLSLELWTRATAPAVASGERVKTDVNRARNGGRVPIAQGSAA